MPPSNLIRTWWAEFWDQNYHTPDVFLTYAYQKYDELKPSDNKLDQFKLKVIDEYLPKAEARMIEVEALKKLPRRIFITGDLHGTIDIKKLNTNFFPEQKELSKHDLLIILGDFGLVWDVNESKKEEQHWVDWLSSRNYTTVVVLGNHENYDRIETLPKVKMFGGNVIKYTDSIFLLERGAVYTINDRKFYTMGGAQSIDKDNRTDKITWWRQEIPSHEEFENGMTCLEECDYKVDYVLTHTAPKRVIIKYMHACRDTYINEFKSQFAGGEMPEEYYDRIVDQFVDVEYFEAKQDVVSDYLEDIFFGKTPLTFDKHFFGHLHDEWVSKDGDHIMLYRKIIELEL